MRPTTRHRKGVRAPATVVAAVAALLAGALAMPGPAWALGNLDIGSRGPRVGAVQKALGLPADRIFGPATRRAVKRFQRRHGIAADGIVGPATWALVKRVRARQRAARAGDRRAAARHRRGLAVAADGDVDRRAVARLQRALGIAADGDFGPRTADAVRRLQRRHGLAADGVVGPATWAALGMAGPVLRMTMPARVRRVVAAANRIARKPYRYGGGHARWDDRGYDCSGSVSYALHGAGLLPRALSSRGFMRWGAPGRGRWITIYAARHHVFMVVAGRRFDTTGRARTGTRWQPRMRGTGGYVVRHPPGF